MAGYGADLDETPRWRLSILFMIIVILSLIGHVGLHMLEEYFKRHKRIGLKHTLQSLKDELFALGLITLLLLVFQDDIVKICIDGNSAKNDYNSSYSSTDYPAKNRKLLAGGYYECPGGEESFWSLTALHEIHILIFLIAVVHLFQAGVSMICGSIRVQRWKKYEKRDCHDMVALKRKRAIKTKGSWAGLWIYSFFTQFSDSVDGPVYLAIRRFFLEKMELDDDFNFHQFVLDSMEEDFAKLVEFQWIMWLIAAVWIIIPWEAHIIIWLPCVFFIIMLIMGAKLQSIAISLASLAYTHYNPHFIPHKKRNKSILRKSASKIKGMLSRTSLKENLATIAKKQQASQSAITGGTQGVQMTSQVTNNGKKGSDVSVSTENDEVQVNTAVIDPQKMLSTDQPVMDNNMKQQETNNAEIQSNENGAEAVENRGNVQTDVKNQVPVEKEVEGKETKEATNKQSQIAEYMAQTDLLVDSRSLFWFGKPKLMLIVFQYMYFVSGLVIALLILDEWRGQRINHLTGDALYILMIGVNVLMIVHAAIFVIPSYAISVAAGAYGPDNILKKALKRNVKPQLAKKLDLERRSYSLQGSDNESVEEGDAGESHATQHGGHGHDDIRIGTLLDAMEQSQVRKKKLEALDAPASSSATSKDVPP
eukprot:TRINITY_DN4094_c1_g1_i4.p1 TRINITY_DN4094_c1_g1~~TRINITY_DN4094_c1_g1_i4.p1  ORF type:complete len:649 (+),score=89.07 TRINITY_DN4094_c1_g1_i4:255-2201(+)